MRVLCFCVCVAAAVWAAPDESRADEASHRAAVESLLAVMGTEKSHAATLESLLQTQIRQNPAMAALQQLMREFFNKHLGWSAIREDIIKLYAEAFSEDELGKLAEFYRSPLGKKSLEQIPSLSAKSMQKAQERMREHLPEFQAALKAAAEKSGAVPPSPAK